MKRFALVVGTDQYEDPTIRSLQYAEDDATALWGLLKHRASYDDVRLLRHPDLDQVQNSTVEMISALGPGDLFLFFFAGHGITHEGRHLLLCPKARLGRLQYLQHTVPLDLLKDETVRDGLHRVFILDACRTDLRDGRAPTGESSQDDSVLRDLVSVRRDERTSPMTLLCSCGEKRQAMESTQLGHGLFTRALVDEFEDALRGDAALTVGESLQQNLRRRMHDLATRVGLPADQRPWVQMSDAAPVLHPGRQEATRRALDTTPARPLCPVCGRRNDPNDTFRCKSCERDYVCLDHLVRDGWHCEDCAHKAASKRGGATSGPGARVELQNEDGGQRQATVGSEVRTETPGSVDRAGGKPRFPAPEVADPVPSTLAPPQREFPEGMTGLRSDDGATALLDEPDPPDSVFSAEPVRDALPGPEPWWKRVGTFAPSRRIRLRRRLLVPGAVVVALLATMGIRAALLTPPTVELGLGRSAYERATALPVDKYAARELSYASEILKAAYAELRSQNRRLKPLRTYAGVRRLAMAANSAAAASIDSAANRSMPMARKANAHLRELLASPAAQPYRWGYEAREALRQIEAESVVADSLVTSASAALRAHRHEDALRDAHAAVSQVSTLSTELEAAFVEYRFVGRVSGSRGGRPSLVDKKFVSRMPHAGL
jgi:hypothetical protein